MDSNYSEEGNNINCLYQKDPDNYMKFIMLIVITPIICIVGIIGNLLSILTYTRPSLSGCNSFFLVAIAVSDMITITTAAAIYPVEIIIEYFQLINLSRLWHSYINVVYTLSNTGPFLSVYMTIVATMERFICTKCPAWHNTLYNGNRMFIGIVFVVIFSIALNIGKYWEFELHIREECDNLARYYLQPSNLALESTSFQFYSFWLYTSTCCILPFLCLFVMNVIIARSANAVENVGRQYVLTAPFAAHFSKRIIDMRKHQMNKVVVMIVLAFLIFNLPGVILSVWEFVSLDFLTTHWSFYGFFKDAINILTVISASVNFFIYLGFDCKFRETLSGLMKS